MEIVAGIIFNDGLWSLGSLWLNNIHLYFWGKWRAVYEVELKIKNGFLLYVNIAVYAYYPVLCVHKEKNTQKTQPYLPHAGP